MKREYWHLQRYLALAGSSEPLPIESPFVRGRFLKMPEPVWRTGLATALSQGVPDVFATWHMDEPLPVPTALEVSRQLEQVLETLRPDDVMYPRDLVEDDRPDGQAAVLVLEGLKALCQFAAGQGRSVVTWVD